MSSSWPVITFCVLAVSVGISGGQAAADQPPSADARAKRFIEQHEATVRPLEIEMNLAWWNANVTGKEEDFQKKQAAEEKLGLCLADPQRFAELKAVREARPTDPILAREIEVLYLQYLEKQVPPELIKKMLAHSNAVERAFNDLSRQRRRQGTHGQRRPPRLERPRTTRPSAGRHGRRARSWAGRCWPI